MPKLSEYTPEPGREHGFRRGYTHGAQAVINAIDAQLTDVQRAKLARWMSRDVLDWSARAGDEVETPPDPPTV